MTKITNTFNQGLDRDSSKNKYDNVHYWDAKNMRLVTQEGLSSGAMENLRGTYLRLNMAASGHYICGHVVMGEYLVIWTTSNNTSSPNGSSIDRIFKVPISTLEALTGTSTLTLSTNWFHDDPVNNNLVYTGNLWLCTGNLIVSVARYENDDIQKVYWVDTYNRLRHINTVYNADTNDLENMTEDKLDAISDIVLTQPTVIDIVGGNLKSGKIQYGYQLYNKYGAETVFSPFTGLVNITNYPEVSSTSEDYKGSDIDETTGKAVKCSVDIASAGYTRIRFVAIHYTSLAGDPEIRILQEREISGSIETIYFTDTGSNLGSLLLEDIRLVGTSLFSPEELETKDNILFPANITEESFDVTYDARAYRFGGINATDTEPNYNDDVEGSRGVARVFQNNEKYYEIDGSSKSLSGDADGASGDWEDIPSNADCINKFNDLDNDGDHEFRFMYQADGIVLGGEGPNVKYEFKTKSVTIDTNTATIQRLYTIPEGTVDNPSYTDYASPYNVEKYLGYHRDEIYRFGIVFFDDKGRSSFVKWIGDIRMPSISTISEASTYGEAVGGGTTQTGTITIDDAIPHLYTVEFDDEVYSFENHPNPPDFDGYDTVQEIAVALRAEIVAGGKVTCGTPVAGVFTIEWDNPSGEFSVVTSSQTTYAQTRGYTGSGSESYDYATAWNEPVADVTNGNILYLSFEVSSLPAGVESFQIVRVKRESLDRSIMAQGIVGPVVGGVPDLWDLDTGYSDMYTFQSPEVAFNKNLTRRSNDHLQEVGEFDANVDDDSTWGLLTYKYTAIMAMNNPQLPRTAGGIVAGDEHESTSKTDIVDGQIVSQDAVEANIGGTVYTVNNATTHTDKGIAFVFEASNTSWRSKDKPYTHASDGRKLINYRRNIFNTQYGGLTFNNRKQNLYIATSDIKSNVATTVAVYGGDTYVGMFDYLYASWEEAEGTSTRPEVIYFPVETSINLPLRLDDPYHIAWTSQTGALIHDYAGVHTGGALTDFAQTNDLYLYNTVYSKENDAKLFIQAPFDWTSQTDFPVRVYASNVKTGNELADSWLKFGANAYKEVDPQFGEITKLITVNEKLMFYQPKAFGILSVNERALLQTGDISQLSLGVSGVLERYDYAKTGIGASDTRHVLLTPNGLYWIDTINKAMYKYTGGPEEISLMKGMDHFFRTALVNGDTTFLFTDPEFKEVCVNDYTDNWTLVYSEITDSFREFIDFFPDYVINYNDKVWGSRNSIAFYKHNDTGANRGYLYGSYYDSYITFLINPNGSEASVFNNMEWLTEVYTNAGVEADVTFDTIQYWNDYQGSVSTGTTLTSGTNIKRRMRKWRHVIPRVGYEPDGSTPKTRTDARFRDTHLFVKLTYTNDSNDRRFISHDITTSFRSSNM